MSDTNFRRPRRAQVEETEPPPVGASAVDPADQRPGDEPAAVPNPPPMTAEQEARMVATLTAAAAPFHPAPPTAPRFFINAIEPGEVNCAGNTYVVPEGRYEVISTNPEVSTEALADHILGVLSKRGATLERVVR